MSRYTLCFLLLLFAFSMLFRPASAEDETIFLELDTQDWSWEEGTASGFSGTVLNRGDDLQNVLLKLEIETDPPAGEESRLVFTYFNQKKIKYKKQSDQYIIDSCPSGQTFVFSGMWQGDNNPPPNRVTLRIIAQDTDGNRIGTAERVLGTGAEGQAVQSTQVHMPFDLNKIILCMTLLAVLLWCAAVIRKLFIRKTEINRRRA